MAHIEHDTDHYADYTSRDQGSTAFDYSDVESSIVTNPYRSGHYDEQELDRTFSYRRGDDAHGLNLKSYAARAGGPPKLAVDTSPEILHSAQSASSPPHSSIPRSALRQGSVTHKSPLQKLEITLGDLSKEEKRARAEEAEHRALERQASRAHPAASSQAKRDAFLDDGQNARNRAYAQPSQGSAQAQASHGAGIRRSDTRPRGSGYNTLGAWERRFGYDAALSGVAATAAVGAYESAGKYYSGSKTAHPQNPGAQFAAQRGLNVQPDHSTSMGTDRDMQAADNDLPPALPQGNKPRKSVGFEEPEPPSTSPQPDEDLARGHRFPSLHRHEATPPRRYQRSPLSEGWKSAQTVCLEAADQNLEQEQVAWWEKNEPETSRRKSSHRRQASAPPSAYGFAHDGRMEKTAFRPPISLKCGPLLRYSGIRSDETNRKYWRGSVMIVTDDENSSYSTIPTLRLFKQPMELARPPQPRYPEGNLQNLVYDPSDDPVAGLPKCSSTGETLYVKPADMVKSNLDLSCVEGDDGLFEKTAVPVNENAVLSRLSPKDGEKMAKFKEVEASRLHAERGFTFWRFNIEVELTQEQSRIAYRINHGPSTGFWVPAADQSMHMMFHSCNGFSMSVDAASFCGPDPMWRDVLNQHQYRPFHVMIGGGDQIYNDAVTRQTEHFQEWLSIKNPEHKHNSPFTAEMQEELESFYLDRYAMWFSQGLFGLANSQIPMVNIWDDHDIIDGFGSYPDHFMRTPVFSGIGGVAFKYYMLFQHQSVPDETEQTEPSWILGARPGPYIGEVSRSIFMSLGSNVSLVGIDCRTERQRDAILSQESYDNIFDRCHDEIVKGETKHLLVLLGVPIAYPRLNFLENILTSRMMDPIKALGRTGVLGGFVNKFDGGVEILDDLDDHWTAKHHKRERNWFINELQELAASKSVRITILGGDVHLGAIGRFFSKAKLGIPKDRDHRYMPNVISSAIVNTPPPEVMADVLNKRNKIHHLDAETDEDMIPIFSHDVDGRSRNNQRLLPRRNWCSICEFDGISSPSSTPLVEPNPRPGFMRRFSVGANDGSNATSRPSGASKLLRRLSGRVGTTSRNASSAGTPSQAQSIQDLDVDDGGHNFDDTSLTDQRPRANSIAGDGRHTNGPQRTASFKRLPNNTDERSAKKDSTGRQGHIDLQHGLNITLNFEIDQRDPSGQTTQYSLIVPALSYDGPADVNSVAFRGTTRTMMSDLGRKFTRKRDVQGHANDYDAVTALDGNREILERSESAHNANLSAPAAAVVGLGVAGVYHENKANAHLDNNSVSEAQQDTWNDEYQEHMDVNTSGWSPSSSGQKSKGLQEPDSSRGISEVSPQHKDSASTSLDSTHQNGRHSGNSASLSQGHPGRKRSLRAGPPAPKNIDQLPLSVQNRYSKFVDEREQLSSPISNEGYATARNSFEQKASGPGAAEDDPRLHLVNGYPEQSQKDPKNFSPATGRRLQKPRTGDNADRGDTSGIGRSPSLMQRVRNRLTPRQHSRAFSVDESNRFAQDPQARHVPWLHEAAEGSFTTPNTVPRTSMSQPRQQHPFGPLTSHSTGHDNPLTAAHRDVIYSQHFGQDRPDDGQWMGVDASPDISPISVDTPPARTKPSKFERLAGVDVLDQNDTIDTLGQQPRRAKTERTPQSRPNGRQLAHDAPLSRPRPYSGPGAGAGRGADGGKSAGGLLPAPRPTGLGMSERAARQLGYEDGVPTLEEQGSWLERAQAKQRRDINRRSSDSGAPSSRRSSWRRWLE